MAIVTARANHQCSAVLSLKPQLRGRVLISHEKISVPRSVSSETDSTNGELFFPFPVTSSLSTSKRGTHGEWSHFLPFIPHHLFTFNIKVRNSWGMRLLFAVHSPSHALFRTKQSVKQVILADLSTKKPGRRGPDTLKTMHSAMPPKPPRALNITWTYSRSLCAGRAGLRSRKTDSCRRN